MARNLRPQEIDQLGLTRALEKLVRDHQMTHGPKFQTDIANIDAACADKAKVELYRMMQEGLGNILAHASATSVEVLITQEDSAIRVTLRDNGRGFDTNGAASSDKRVGMGLGGLRERARLLGGEARIRSAPGQGTEIDITIPRLKAKEGGAQASPSVT